MKLSNYVRVWLENGKGPRIKETSDYVKFLESEIDQLKSTISSKGRTYKTEQVGMVRTDYDD